MSWLLVILGYLLGSIPTAFFAGHVFRGRDIRRLGDGNAGAANVFREVNPAAGIAVGLIDAGKGAAAVLAAQDLGASLPIVLMSGAAAVIGHNFPIFLGFRGGRGESTAIGEFLVLVPYPLLISAVPALITLTLSRNVVLASAIMFILMVALSWWMGVSKGLIAFSIAILLIVAFTHFLRIRLLPVRVPVKSDKNP